MRTRRIRRDFSLAGVYIIRNLTNGKVYIGSSTDVLSRLRTHESKLIAGTHKIREMQDDFNANHHFSFEVLEGQVFPRRAGHIIMSYADRRRLYRIEWENICKFDAIAAGYNTGLINPSNGPN